MLIAGIIGGSGCGKSYVSSSLGTNDFYHMDCDKIARIVVEPNTPCLQELRQFFGDDIINPDESLNRKKLASIAFSSAENTQMLNSITLKYIVRYIKEDLIRLKKSGVQVVLMDGATIIESGLNKICNFIISVIAPKEQRIARIIARDNLSNSEAEKRISAQKDDNFYIANSNFVLVNNSTLEELNNKIELLNKFILNLKG